MTVEVLQNVLLFKNLNTEALIEVENYLSVIELPSRTVLFQEGDQGSDIYIVKQGYLEVIKSLGGTEERIIALRGPGEFVGEISLVNQNSVRTASIRAKNDTVVWQMSHKDLLYLLEEYPGVSLALVEVLGEKLTIAHEVMLDDLRKKNEELRQAYDELVNAQSQIIKMERLDKELQMGYEIQMSILPREVPQIDGVDIGAYLSPAREVGGDFYDFKELEDGRLVVFIGDVTGKGVPAAIYMAQMHAFLYSGISHGTSHEEILLNANYHIYFKEQSSLYVTILLGILDPQKKQFSYIRAGHELPIITNRNGETKFAEKSTGQLLGVLEDPVLDHQVIQFKDDDVIVLYTDGIVDANNEDEECFGMERFISSLEKANHQGAGEIVETLVNDLRDFQGESEQADDVTLIVIRLEDGDED